MEDNKMHDILNEQDEAKKKQKYNEYVKQVTPTHNWLVNMGHAFLVGGSICVIGQFLINRFQTMGFDKETAGLYGIICLILISNILTGLQVYERLAKYAGAGTVVPITGFANSVASPAIEFQKEGQVFGIGCKIFTIAGPVILYGIFSSWVLGLIYWFGKVIGIV